jgi:hypothetical protein
VRRLLAEGAPVLIHYLATTEAGTVERVEEDGRRVIVVAESGAVLEFHLMASAHFVTRDRSARLGF